VLFVESGQGKYGSRNCGTLSSMFLPRNFANVNAALAIQLLQLMLLLLLLLLLLLVADTSSRKNKEGRE
jgi:hypothetical protein